MTWQRVTWPLAVSETVLLVEDNAQIRDAGRRILETAGYTVIPAETPMEAVAPSRTAKS